jgi:hypothetical protein
MLHLKSLKLTFYTQDKTSIIVLNLVILKECSNYIFRLKNIYISTYYNGWRKALKNWRFIRNCPFLNYNWVLLRSLHPSWKEIRFSFFPPMKIFWKFADILFQQLNHQQNLGLGIPIQWSKIAYQKCNCFCLRFKKWNKCLSTFYFVSYYWRSIENCTEALRDETIASKKKIFFYNRPRP